MFSSSSLTEEMISPRGKEIAKINEISKIQRLLQNVIALNSSDITNLQKGLLKFMNDFNDLEEETKIKILDSKTHTDIMQGYHIRHYKQEILTKLQNYLTEQNLSSVSQNLARLRKEEKARTIILEEEKKKLEQEKEIEKESFKLEKQKLEREKELEKKKLLEQLKQEQELEKKKLEQEKESQIRQLALEKQKLELEIEKKKLESEKKILEQESKLQMERTEFEKQRLEQELLAQSRQQSRNLEEQKEVDTNIYLRGKSLNKIKITNALFSEYNILLHNYTRIQFFPIEIGNTQLGKIMQASFYKEKKYFVLLELKKRFKEIPKETSEIEKCFALCLINKLQIDAIDTHIKTTEQNVTTLQPSYQIQSIQTFQEKYKKLYSDFITLFFEVEISRRYSAEYDIKICTTKLEELCQKYINEVNDFLSESSASSSNDDYLDDLLVLESDLLGISAE